MKNIGIIGGVGPIATELYYHSLVTKVETLHGEKPEITVYNLGVDPEIENAFIQGYECVDKEIYLRTRYLLLQVLEKFVQNSITTIAMPCNTLQPLLEDICKKEASSFHNINLIEETSMQVARQKVKRVLIIGTNETCRSNIYGDTLKRSGIEHTYLAEDDQQIVAQHISACLRAPQDASPYLKNFIACIERASHDVDGVVIACTDLSGHVLNEHLSTPVIDSLQALVDSSAEYILS
ncbi:MAG: aspartate/glutamate racemase family protein [Ktedonobacteraceae bacterium]|nr:aspartate/glutamate racemase family protein [Ktedonobacteraceae bacterium]